MDYYFRFSRIIWLNSYRIIRQCRSARRCGPFCATWLVYHRLVGKRRRCCACRPSIIFCRTYLIARPVSGLGSFYPKDELEVNHSYTDHYVTSGGYLHGDCRLWKESQLSNKTVVTIASCCWARNELGFFFISLSHNQTLVIVFLGRFYFKAWMCNGCGISLIWNLIFFLMNFFSVNGVGSSICEAGGSNVSNGDASKFVGQYERAWDPGYVNYSAGRWNRHGLRTTDGEPNRIPVSISKNGWGEWRLATVLLMWMSPSCFQQHVPVDKARILDDFVARLLFSSQMLS